MKPVKTPYPEFRPKPYRELSHLLGEADSLVEWIEVGVRHLESEHKSGGTARTGALASQYNIRVQGIDWALLNPRVAGLQITAVCQYLEWFLDEFRSEVPHREADRKRGESLLDYTLRLYGLRSSVVGQFECDLVAYYSGVRNHMAHALRDDQKKSAQTVAQRLRAQCGATQYSKLGAPNTVDALTFDDFVLVSRALKNLGRGICANITLSDADVRQAILGDQAFVARLRRRKENGKVGCMVSRYIVRRFGLASTAGAIANRLIDNGLLAQRLEPPPP